MIFQANKRRGFTLIELVATMGVASVMAAIAVAMLYLLLGLERESREGLRRRAALSHLAEQFRDDAHAAVAFAESRASKPPGGGKSPPVWEFQLGNDRVVRYSRADEALLRTERDGGKPVGQESFALGPRAEVSIERSNGEAPSLVSLRIAPRDGPAHEPSVRDVRIDALLGSDHRFLRREEPSP